MRIKRELLLSPTRDSQSAIYHCVSRCVNREFYFKKEEKEWFLQRMHKQARFSGVSILSFALMSNHFHLLIKVPPKNDQLLPADEFMARLKSIASKTTIQRVERLIEPVLLLEGDEYEVVMRSIQQSYLKRMNDLSIFIKELKLAFTQWFNHRTKRVGTLWEGRFKSVLVQSGFAAQMTSAYIDLNPVRAGIISDPKDYRWSSYGASVAGDRRAQKGLIEVMESHLDDVPDGGLSNDHSDWSRVIRRAQAGVEKSGDLAGDWTQASRQYRMFLAEEGEMTDSEAPVQLGENQKTRHKRRRGFTAEEVEKILRENGELSMAELLRCRVRYFTDGAVLGTSHFVEEVFEQVKASKLTFRKRKTGARPWQGIKGRRLFSLRDLKRRVFG